MGDNAAFFSHGQVVVQGEEDIDENYDPTDFLHSLGQPQESAAPGPSQHSPDPGAADMPTYDVGDHEGERVPVELHHAEDGSMIINPVEAAAAASVDVINDDLDISDSDEESDQPSSGGHHPSAPEPPPPDEDGIWF